MYDAKGNQQETIDFMMSFREALVQSVTDACEERIVITPQQMKDLFKLGSFGIRHTQRVAPEAETRKVWDAKAWELLGEKLANSERFKGSVGLQKTCQKLADSQRRPASTKRKVVEDSEAADDLPKVKRKKTRN